MINMELEKSNYQAGKFRKFVPCKPLNDGWHYYKLHNSNVIVGVRVVLDETYFVTERGGEPVLNENKNPIIEWNQKIETRILSENQYKQILESGFEDST